MQLHVGKILRLAAGHAVQAAPVEEVIEPEVQPTAFVMAHSLAVLDSVIIAGLSLMDDFVDFVVVIFDIPIL